MNWRDQLNGARIEVDTSTRQHHLGVIGAALEVERSRRSRPGRALAVAIALLLLLPVVAFAAERSEPGDALYPVRQAMERANIRIPDLNPRIGTHQVDDRSGSLVTYPGSSEGGALPTSDDEEQRRDIGSTTTTTAPERTGTTLSRLPPTTTRPPPSTTLPESPSPTRPGR